MEELVLARVKLDPLTEELLTLNTSSFARIAHALELLESIYQTQQTTASKAVRIRLGLPKITRKGIVMPYPLLNDEVDTINILTDNAAGVPVPPPPGDTFAVTCNIPTSLNAVVNGATVVINALVAQHINPPAPSAPDLFITVSDSAGSQVFVQAVDILPDASAKSITLDLVNVTHVSQPVPTAPGP